MHQVPSSIDIDVTARHRVGKDFRYIFLKFEENDAQNIRKIISALNVFQPDLHKFIRIMILQHSLSTDADKIHVPVANYPQDIRYWQPFFAVKENNLEKLVVDIAILDVNSKPNIFKIPRFLEACIVGILHDGDFLMSTDQHVRIILRNSLPKESYENVHVSDEPEDVTIFEKKRKTGFTVGPEVTPKDVRLQTMDPKHKYKNNDFSSSSTSSATSSDEDNGVPGPHAGEYWRFKKPKHSLKPYTFDVFGKKRFSTDALTNNLKKLKITDT